MRLTKLPILVAAVVIAASAQAPAVAQSTPPATPSLPPLTLFGKVELSPGVACAGCKVIVEGVPIQATTDANGQWSINSLPPGRWDLNVASTTTAFGSARFQCGGNSAEVGACGTVVIAKAGGISGRITFNTTSEYDLAVVGVPELGVYTQLNCGGGYLLPGVGPGMRKLVVSTNTQTKELWVWVNPGKVTMNMNLVFASVATPPGS
jgi:hypothetical protein